MRHSHLIGALCAVVFPLLPTLSHAVLIDRGGGLIYDNVLDITWLQDTNYALTSGVNDGKMGWQEANDWAAGLSYDDTVRGVAYTDWRLPEVRPIDGNAFNLTETNNATSDEGYAPTTTDGSDGGWRDGSGIPVNEMGYMFYVNLGNFGKCDELYVTKCDTTTRDWGLNNTGLFTNWSQIDPEPVDPGNSLGNYATGTDFFDEIDAGLDGDYVWDFDFPTGKSRLLRKDKAAYPRLAAWAVRDGDVALSAIPVPASVWLFGSGLLGLIGIARRKKAA